MSLDSSVTYVPGPYLRRANSRLKQTARGRSGAEALRHGRRSMAGASGCDEGRWRAELATQYL